jgi:uncharacterized protein (DUF1778 family)
MTESSRRASAPRLAVTKARLFLRLTPEQRRLFEEAASAKGQTVTRFVVRSAEVAARDVLADRTRFVLAPEGWEAFSNAIDREPRVLPRLAAFLATPGPR